MIDNSITKVRGRPREGDQLEDNLQMCFNELMVTKMETHEAKELLEE